jgi:hypothetical protein
MRETNLQKKGVFRDYQKGYPEWRQYGHIWRIRAMAHSAQA